MEGVFQIPVLGEILEFVAYLVGLVVQTDLGRISLALATPIALGALCGIMNERSGVVNIGIEGMMLASAFVGFFAAAIVSEKLAGQPWPIFGATPALLVGVAVAVATGMLVSTLHAWLSISIRADQIISGTIINILALGLTSYLNRLLSVSNASAGSFETFRPPSVLSDLPAIGWIFRMLLAQGPITLSVIVLMIVMQVLLFRSRWGLRTRAVGEHPKAADTVGIDVIRTRYRNVILGGAFAGLAGAFLTLEYGSSFQNGMTAGTGFIALAAVIVGRWTPVGAFAAAMLFGFSGQLGVALRSDPPPGGIGEYLVGIQQSYPSLYNNFFAALPYVLTIVILAGVVGRSIPPAAVGRPYQKEATA